jgi:hypothetical protein
MADITVTAKLVRPLPGALSIRVQAGSALNVGDAVYMASDGKVDPTDADAAVSAPVLGIVISAPNGALAAVLDDWVDVVFVGRVTGFSGMTPGIAVYNSITAGRVADTRGLTGDFPFVVGYALTAETVLVNPFADQFIAV